MKISHVLIYGVSKWHFKPYFAVAQTFRQSAVPWKIEKKAACVIYHFIRKILTHSFIEEKFFIG